MTKQELQNIVNIFGSEEVFRQHLSALQLDNTKRLECRPATSEKDTLYQTTIIDWDKEFVVGVTKVGDKPIETVITGFDCIQNVVLRYKNFEEAVKYIPAINSIDPVIKRNLCDDFISFNTEGF